MAGTIFEPWTDKDRDLWGHVPQTLRHGLHSHPLFSREALAELIDRFPRNGYSLIQMGAQGGRKLWREGDIGGLKGKQVIEWIEKGRIWINLRAVHKVDPRYGELLEAAYREIAANTGTGPMFNIHMGILISSPMAQVYYHSDLLGQALWQIIGRKRVFFYPNHPPFLTMRQLEDIAILGVEVDMIYHDWYDEYAKVVELQPGQMAHWPLNGPHRVENLDMLNVSVTTEHLTKEIERRHRVTMANGLLRHRFGLKVEGRATAGPSYWSKMAFQAVMRRTKWLDKVRDKMRPIEFKLDPNVPGGILDLDRPVTLNEQSKAA